MASAITTKAVDTTAVPISAVPAGTLTMPKQPPLAGFASPVLPDARSTRAIARVRTAGVAIAAPGSGGAVSPPATPSPAQGATGAKLDPILGIVNVIAANQGRIAQLAELGDKAGNALGRIGNETLGVASDGVEVVERLWSGSWLGKVAAIFTAVGTVLLFAIGGALAATGWAIRSVSGAVLGAFGEAEGDEPAPPPPDKERHVLERQDAAARLGLEEGRELSREERERAALLVDSCTAAGLQTPRV